MKSIDLKATRNLPRKANKLFRIYARFEFALKENGFIRAGYKDEVIVCWDLFANKCLGKDFFVQIQNNQIAPKLLNIPPSKQILIEGKLEWDKNPQPPTDIQSLLVAVRRVRNNLLHGGKSGDIDNQRNNELVQESIGILLLALQKCDEIRDVFEGRY